MKVPTQPPIDGLPVGWQIAISVIVGLATLAVAFKGYFIRDNPKTGSHIVPDSPQTAAIMAATIADMGAVRNLSDCVVRLDASIVRLCSTIDEHTHFERNSIELDREIAQRLRELREATEKLTEIADKHLK
jgi:hypothetical protein